MQLFIYIPGLLLLFMLSFNTEGQKKDEKSLSILFYNVENLFDTLDSPDFEDEEFLPGTEKNWNSDKYLKKIEDLSRIMGSVNHGVPEIIGLAEIENRRVLEDILSMEAFKKDNYGIIHRESPDIRGIDVALLYKKDVLKLVDFNTIKIDFPPDTSFHTRDILYVKMMAADGKHLHLFVNHWNSRSGGQKESEIKRMYSAVSLRREIDMLLIRERDPRIVIMGDFNDEPTNRSVYNILMAGNKRKNMGPGDLYNLFYDIHNLKEKGTYYYQGKWNMLDQIICSYNLIDRDGFYSCGYGGGNIFKTDGMLFENNKGEKIPSRTYGGTAYFGGVSDHLPVYVIMEIN